MYVAPSLGHPDQAGFMKGRKIKDQVKLAKFLLNYPEAAEEDGLIVALDQEKAYDRINHTYRTSTHGVLAEISQHNQNLLHKC
jgi:hypothetical protein